MVGSHREVSTNSDVELEGFFWQLMNRKRRVVMIVAD